MTVLFRFIVSREMNCSLTVQGREGLAHARTPEKGKS